MPIYVLGLGTDIDEAGLREIAQATGALYFNAPQASDLQALYETVGAQLAEQYAISYTSKPYQPLGVCGMGAVERHL